MSVAPCDGERLVSVNPHLDEAQRLATLGYRVFPLRPKSKAPLRGTRGVRDASFSRVLTQARWTQTPEANIGLACGEGLLVLDVDPGAVEAWGAEAVGHLVVDWAGKPQARTPRGGCHLFMRAPGGVELRNSAGRLGPGLDIKTDGGTSSSRPRWSWTRPRASTGRTSGSSRSIVACKTCPRRPRGDHRRLASGQVRRPRQT